jgi:DNA-binding NarL/FixJ family response regulator
MKFLMIDDDNYKINNVKEFMGDNEIEIAMSYASGMRKLITNKYDGIILDMQFPQFDDEPWTINDLNGLCILSEMERRNIETPVIIYSSDVQNVNKFKNVKGYIINNSTYIGDRIKNFIDQCNNK